MKNYFFGLSFALILFIANCGVATAQSLNEMVTNPSGQQQNANETLKEKESKYNGAYGLDFRFPKGFEHIGLDLNFSFTYKYVYLNIKYTKPKYSDFGSALTGGFHRRFYVGESIWFAPMIGFGFGFYPEYDDFQCRIQLEPRIGMDMGKYCIFAGYRFDYPLISNAPDFIDCGGLAIGLGINF